MDLKEPVDTNRNVNPAFGRDFYPGGSRGNMEV
jgi:hypothetical protein